MRGKYRKELVSALCIFGISIPYKFLFAYYIFSHNFHGHLRLDMLYTFIKSALAILQKQDNQIKPIQNLPGLT